MEEMDERKRLSTTAFNLMDAEALKFDDEAFDVVLCGFGVAFFPDTVRAMPEMHRVLRPGGRVALSWWTKDSPGHRWTR